MSATKAVFAFGRFQPPTRGHGVLIGAVADEAKATGATAYIFVSQSQNKYEKYTRAEKNLVSQYKNTEKRNTTLRAYRKTKQNENPLSVARKIYFLRKMFPDADVEFVNTATTGTETIFKAIRWLKGEGYEDITLFRGTDRENSFSAEKMGEFGVKVAAVERNETSANLLKGMSGSKMREAAVRGDLAALAAGVKIGSMTNENVEDMRRNIVAGIFEPLGAPEGEAAPSAAKGTKRKRNTSARSRKTRQN